MEAKLIKDYFTRSTITIDSLSSVKEAIDVIFLNKLRHLPVVDTENIVVGMISDRDILPLIRVFGEEAEMLRKTEVQTIMTTDVQVISSDESLATAAQMMVDGSFHALPVVDNQKLAGIITSTDLLRTLIEEENPQFGNGQNFIPTDFSEQD